MIKAVIFDLDGVIIDTKELHYLAWKKFWAKRGIEHTYDDFIKKFGIPNQDIFKELYENMGVDELNDLCEEKEVYFRELSEGKLMPMKGAAGLIKSLKKEGYKIALGTSCQKSNIEFIMKQIGLKAYFDVIVCAADIKSGKPNPEIFLKAAEMLNVKPLECVVIEDSLHGIEAAIRAGMKCIAVATTHSENELKNAFLVRQDLSKLSLADIKRL